MNALASFNKRAFSLALAAALIFPSMPVKADETEVTGEVNLDNGGRLRHAYAMDLDEAGRQLYVTGYDSHNILKYDLTGKRVVAEAAGLMNPHTVKFHVASQRVFALGYDANSDGVLVIYDKDLVELHRISLGTYSYSLTLSADGTKAYVGVLGGLLSVDTDTGAVTSLASMWDFYYPFAIVEDKHAGRDRILVLGMGWWPEGSDWVMKSALMSFSPSGLRQDTLVLGNGLMSFDAAQDGDELYIANIDANSLHVVNLANMQLVTQIAGVSCPQKLVIHPTRKRLYVIDNYLDRFHVINTVTKKKIKTIFPGDDPSGVVFDSTGKCYTANFWSNDIGVIDTETEEVSERIPLAAASPHSLYLDSQGNRLYVTNGSSNGIFIIDPKTGALIDQLTMPDGAFGGPLIVRHNKLFVVDKWRNGVGVYPLNSHNNAFVASHAEAAFIPLPGVQPSGIAEGSGNMLYVPFVKGANLVLAKIDSSSEQLKKEIDLGAGTASGGVAVSNKKKRAYVADYGAGEVIVVNLQNDTLMGTLSVERKPNSIAVHPASDRVYVANEEANSIAVIDDDPMEVLGFMDVGQTPTAIGFAASKARIYVLNAGDQTMSVIDELTHKVVEVLPVETDGASLLVMPGTDDIFVANPGAGQLVTLRDNFQASFVALGPDSTFSLRDAFGFPNPARSVNPTVRVEVGQADAVQLSFFDVSGNLVHEAVLTDAPQLAGGKYVYDYTWNVADAAAGMYLVRMTAKKAGQGNISKTFKLAVLK